MKWNLSDDRFLLNHIDHLGAYWLASHDFNCHPNQLIRRLYWLYENKPDLWHSFSWLPNNDIDFDKFIAKQTRAIKKEKSEERKRIAKLNDDSTKSKKLG
jgi:hypothetical protein